MTSRFCDWLRAWAARICDQRTLERVVDPLLTDLRMEHAAAVRGGRIWRSRWLVAAGAVAFVKAIILWQAKEAMPFSREWSVEDLSGVRRVAVRALSVIAVATLVLEAPFLSEPLVWSHPEVLLYLVPQALVVAIPLGVLCGILFGLRHHGSSSRLRGAVLLAAIVCSIACLMMMGWLVPAANQAFRVVVFGHDGLTPARGNMELTLSELAQRMRLVGEGSWYQYSIDYHERWAFSFATLCLALFALSVSGRLVSPWALGLTAVAVTFLYYVLLSGGRQAVLNHTVPVPVGVWSANVFFLVAWIGFTVCGRSRPPVSSHQPVVRNAGVAEHAQIQFRHSVRLKPDPTPVDTVAQ